MDELRDRGALSGPYPLDQAEQRPYGRKAGRRPLRFTLLCFTARWLAALWFAACLGHSRRPRAGSDGIGAGGGNRRMQRAHGGDQLIRAERLGEADDTRRDRIRLSPGDQEAPAGRRRVLGHQGLDQRGSPFPAQVGVDQECVITDGVHRPGFQGRGRDINAVTGSGQHPVDDGTDRLRVIYHEHSWTGRIPRHSASQSRRPISRGGQLTMSSVLSANRSNIRIEK
jgi:hypothetical protein